MGETIGYICETMIHLRSKDIDTSQRCLSEHESSLACGALSVIGRPRECEEHAKAEVLAM